MSGTSSSTDALRGFNRDRVLAAVRTGAATDRGALGAATGLARSTITGLVRELIADGQLAEDDGAAARERLPGRPARQLRLTPCRDLVVAVDFGHSHCNVGVVDPVGTVLTHELSTLDVDASPGEALRQAERAARTLLAALGPDAARVTRGAVGVPAPVDVRSGKVGDGNLLPRWVDRRPAEELAGRLGIPFFIDNDANLGALAEGTFGASQGTADLIYVKAATGIGAGLLLGGRIHRGVDGRAGEIGHVPIDPGGGLCRCGNRGCLETLASLTQVLAAIRPLHGGQVCIDDVVRLVDAADAGAIRIVTDAGRMIGRVLADIVNSLNPERVVVGGELAAAGTALLDGIRESIDRFAQPGLLDHLTIEPTSLGDQAGLLGAAALALSTVG